MESDPAPYTDIPDPGGLYADPGNSGGSAEEIAAPWIAMAIADSERGFDGSGANFRPNRDECNIAVARCRDDCGDRTNALYSMCGIVGGMIGVAPGTAPKIAAGIFGLACLYNVYNRGSQCKTECVYTVIPCGQ